MGKNILVFFLLLGSYAVHSQIGIGVAAPASSSVLELKSTTRGFLPPRLTTAQRKAIVSPVAGLIIYDTTKNCLEWYDGSLWYNGCGNQDASSTTNGSAIVSGFTCSAASVGTMTVGTAVSGVTQTITATVSTVGTYSISTFANGVTFSGSGTFEETGAQNIELAATGTPVVAETSSFVLNTTPNCSFNRVVSSLPANIVLSSMSPYFVISTYDNDYLPYVTPTAVATLATNVAADGVVDALIDVQGFITTTGLTVYIPYTVTVSSVTLPLFTQTITIPAGSTQDGISRDLTFSYTGGTLGVGSGTITATLKAVGGTLNVKKLDIQTGIGNDNLGYLLGQFTYVINSAGATANFNIRNMASMCGAKISSTVFKVFMCHNLGVTDTTLDPNVPVQGIHGNYYQWGIFTPVATSSTPSGAITSPAWNTSPAVNGSWLDGSKTANDPCPAGYRIPTIAQWTSVIANNTKTITDTGTWTNSSTNFAAAIHFGPNASTKTLTLPAAGFRSTPAGALSYRGSYGSYWSSTGSGSYAYNLLFDSGSVNTYTDTRTVGFSVRCVSQ